MEYKEIVVCSAVRFTCYENETNVKVITLAGVRHHAILQSEIVQNLKHQYTRIEREEGFLTNKYMEDLKEYRFISRRTAKALLEINDQKVNPKPEHNNNTKYCFSEDLY